MSIKAVLFDYFGVINADARLTQLATKLRKNYKVVLLTNANSDYIRPLMKESGLNEIFDLIVVSSEVGLLKPNPKIYEHAVDKLGILPEEAVMIDDMVRNIDGAIEAGLKAIEYNNPEQLERELQEMGVKYG